MYYYLILAFQGYCIYHMYKNKNPYYWFFLIFFIPVIGCVIYLITQVYNKRDAEKIQEEIVSIINPTKKIKDLEKQIEFSDSYQSRVNLADAYFYIKDYNNAIIHYLEALEQGAQSDFYVINKLIESYYELEDYNTVVLYVKKIEGNYEFKKSKAQFIYGMSLEQLAKYDEAETNLRKIDIRYSFYNERLEFAKFLLRRNKTEDAKDVLKEISNESLHMTKPNKRLYRGIVQEVEKLLNSI